MASFEFDNVKAEKEDALWRYNMEKKLKIRLHLTGFLLALFLLSWSWFPTLISATFAVAGDFLRRVVSTFNEPLFTFVLANFIIMVIYIISGQKQTQKQATSTDMDIYDEYVCSSRRSIPTHTASTVAPETEETVMDKQIIFEVNAAPLSPAKQLETTVDTDTIRDTKIPPSPVKQHTTTMARTILTKTKPAAVSSAELKEKEYRRSQSMVSESRNQRPVELRRSKTIIGGGKLVTSSIEPRKKSMDEMSSEEFQLIIDSFIAERKKTLLQENTAPSH
ncbi:CYP722 protein [Hibiscus syriacus]|uniref:CYP722 protein n=1 Tax=Hibiscus syriacus TaxID=106335 RepID=A0A6A3B3G9_HIBSY|nr:uncharacterized protein LOC120118307 [Hibiscus syriacus]KAE8709875.1 CYP722 protein [Hibiscus syriacus]